MFELNETVLPSVWLVIRRELKARPGQTRDELIARLTPAGVVRRADNRSRHVRPTVTALEDLGLIEPDSDGKLRLADAELDEAGFRAAIACRMLSPGEQVDLWEIRPGGQQLEYDAALAVAWLHLQGLEQPVGSWQNATRVLDVQLGEHRRLLRSDVTFNTLDRLARLLGAAASTASSALGQQLIPDPTDLIRTLLPELLPQAAVSITDFLAAAARLLPWLPHGRVGTAVASEMKHVPDPGPAKGAVSQSLSLALVRLEEEAVIQLETGDDPDRRSLLQFPDGDTLGVARVIRQ